MQGSQEKVLNQCPQEQVYKRFFRDFEAEKVVKRESGSGGNFRNPEPAPERVAKKQDDHAAFGPG